MFTGYTLRRRSVKHNRGQELDKGPETAFDVGMPFLANRRLRTWVELALGGAVLLTGALALPLGLASLASAPLVGSGYALAPAGVGPSVPPLAALVIRAFACLPLGDVATRANLASVVAAALAAVWLTRLALEVLAEVTAPPDGATRPAREATCEAIAAAGAVACVMFALGVFVAATSAAGSAMTLALLAGFWVRAFRLYRSPDSPREGLVLALLAGLALGADGLAVLVCWPVALALWGRALRRGDRWPLFAPLLAVAGAGLGLFGALDAGIAGWLGATFSALLAPAAAEPDRLVLQSAADAVTEIGPIAALAAAVGLVVLAARVPRLALATVLAGGTALLLAGPGAAALAPAAVPLAVGISHLAGKLGPARAAAALVIGVVALGWPALDGGGRWTRPARLPERLLGEAHAGIAPRARVNPGSRPMSGLLLYGRALGLRPDVTLEPAATGTVR